MSNKSFSRKSSKKVENTRTIKRKAKNLNIDPNNEELSDRNKNNPRKTTIIERIYSDKTIDEEQEPDPDPDPEPEPEPPKEPPKRVRKITPPRSHYEDEVKKERPPPIQRPKPQIVINDNNDSLDQLKQKIINLENKSNKLEAVNGIFLDMLRNKMVPNKPNEINNPPSLLNPSRSLDISQQQPYQPYILVNPQVPQVPPEVPQYIPVYPIIQQKPQTISLPQLVKSQSQPDFSMNRYSNQYLQNAKDSLKALDRGLQGYFFQNVYDKRNEMQNINEELREMREQIQARLDKMENQQKVQLDGLAFMMKLSGDQYTNNAAARVFGRQLLNKRKDVFDDRLDQLLQFRNSNHGYDNINANYDEDEEEIKTLKRNLSKKNDQLSISGRSVRSHYSSPVPKNPKSNGGSDILPKIANKSNTFRRRVRNDIKPIREEGFID